MSQVQCPNCLGYKVSSEFFENVVNREEMGKAG